MSQNSNHHPLLSLQQVEYMQRLEAAALPPLWEFIDRPDNQIIQQVVSDKKVRQLFSLAGILGHTPEGQLLVELRNHSKLLLAITHRHLSGK